MNLAEWRERQEAGEEFETPSGLVMRLRRVGLLDLAARGTIPAPMVGMVESLLTEGRRSVKVEEFGEYAGTIDLVVMACAVDPPVAEEPGPEVLGVEELPMLDRLAVFNWATGLAAKLRPFRAEEESVAAA